MYLVKHYHTLTISQELLSLYFVDSLRIGRTIDFDGNRKVHG